MTEPTTPVRTVVLEDDDAVRRRLCNALEANPRHVQLLWSGATAEELLGWLDEAHSLASVALVDLGLPGLSGPDMIRALRKRAPHMAIVVLTIFDDARTVLPVFRAGASGYLVKHVHDDAVVAAVTAAGNGGSPITPHVARMLLDAWNGPRHADPFDRLTAREREVLTLLASGFSYANVSTELAISVGTVQGYVKNIYGKLQINSKAEAVTLARRRGFLK